MTCEGGFVADILPSNSSMLRLIARAPGIVMTSRDEDAVRGTYRFRVAEVQRQVASNKTPSFCGRMKMPLES